MLNLLLAALLVQVPVSSPVELQPRVAGELTPAVVEHLGDNALRDRLVRAMQVWYDAGDFLVGAADAALVESLQAGGTAAHLLPQVLPEDELFVVVLEQVDVPAALGEAARLVHAQRGQALVAAPAGTIPQAEGLGVGDSRPFHNGLAVVSRRAWRPVGSTGLLTQLSLQAQAGTNDPRIDALVAASSKVGLESDVQMLSGNFSRNSTVASYIDGARNQIVARLQSMGYSPTIVQFLPQHGDNIQVEILGAVHPDQWVVIGAHYDSRNSSGSHAPAPGADDNASGSAGVLEIARVLAGAGPLERSVRMLWFAGEEYGLYGSEAAADASVAADEVIVGMLNLDMTAFRLSNDKRDVDFITNGTSSQLTDLCDLLGAQYVPGWISRKGVLMGGASDHIPFFLAGYPAVFPFEDLQAHSPYIHTSSDTYTLSTVDFDLALMITRGMLAGAAFLAEPADLVIAHTPLADTPDATGPYLVSAQVSSLIGTTVSSVTLHYSSDGLGFTALPMTAGGPSWSATIPSQGSPATISYYLTAEDDQGNSEALPDGADLSRQPFSFFVGVKTVLYASGFEGVDDAGWTHALISGPDDWKHGMPAGLGGDPAQAFEGQRVWGNDIAGDGLYAAKAHNRLISPTVDCSQAANVTLTFRRWLTVDEGIWDRARIFVNGQVIWQSPSATPLIDTEWVPVTLDISSLAAGNPAVQVEFHLETNDAIGLGGWNLDAFELSERSPGGGCLPPLTYCTPKANSLLCLPLMASSGTPSASSAEPFLATALNIISNKPGLLFYGTAPDAKPFQGGTLCVKAPITRTGLQVSGGNPPPDDCSGSYSFDFNALIQAGTDPALVQGALVCCQYWFRDPGDQSGFGSGLTDALSFTICP